jgi:hypothetical protein
VVIARVFEFYGAGWMIAFVLILLHFYRKNAAGEMFANLKDKIEEDPELRHHYENNVHGARTKVSVLISLCIIAISFALASLWPFALGIRLYNLGHRD